MADEVERDRVAEAAWYVDSGQPREALAALRDADPTDARAVYVRGRALRDMGRDAEAEEVLRRGLAQEPENARLLEMLASVQLASDADAAERTLRKAMQLEPENPDFFYLYVFILMSQERFEWAERMLARLMHLAPDAESTRRARTLFLMRASSSEEALRSARELLREYPDEAYAHYLQGLLLLGGRWWRGMRHLRQAAAMRPQDPLLAETVRVMRSWYMWPVHLTSGLVHYVIAGSLAVLMAVAFIDDHPWGWYLFAAVLSFSGYKWMAVLAGRVALDRRMRRILQHMYGSP